MGEYFSAEVVSVLLSSLPSPCYPSDWRRIFHFNAVIQASRRSTLLYFSSFLLETIINWIGEGGGRILTHAYC